MVVFDVLQKNDYLLLLEAFDTSFLQVPFKHPAKSVEKYIPNGFRPDKLTRAHLIKIYSDALRANEPTLTAFIRTEIERNFQNCSLCDYINSKTFDNRTIDLSIPEVSAILWKNHLTLPAHLVLLLYGIPCSESVIRASVELHKAYCNELDIAKSQSYQSGLSKGAIGATCELESEQKKSAKLQKSLEGASQKRDELKKENKKILSEKLVVESNLSKMQKVVDTLSNRNETLEQDLKKHERNSHDYQEAVKAVKEESQRLRRDLDEATASLKACQKELLSSMEANCERQNLLSDKLIQRLSTEVVMAIRPNNVSHSEALIWAKKMFTATDTIQEGWNKISLKSESTLNDFLSRAYNRDIAQSDIEVLNQIESFVLMEFSVLQSIKVVLSNMLAESMSESGIKDMFEIDEKSQEKNEQ